MPASAKERAAGAAGAAHWEACQRAAPATPFAPPTLFVALFVLPRLPPGALFALFAPAARGSAHLRWHPIGPPTAALALEWRSASGLHLLILVPLLALVLVLLALALALVVLVLLVLVLLVLVQLPAVMLLRALQHPAQPPKYKIGEYKTGEYKIGHLHEKLAVKLLP